MSTYLDFKLKKKGLSVDNAPIVLTLCTTPARELADEVSFNWDVEEKDDEYKYWTVLTLDKLHEIQNVYKERLSALETDFPKYEKEKAKYIDMLPKASNKDNFEMIEERINEIEGYIDWAKEEKRTAEYFLHDFNNLESALEDNKDFEIVYYIG